MAYSTQTNRTLVQMSRYYLNDVWEEYADPRGSKFPIIAGGPWTLLTLVVCFSLFVKIVGPLMMRNRKAFDLRPYMVIFNGFMFGVNGSGFLMAFYLTEGGAAGLSCDAANPRSEEFRQEVVIYLGYVYYTLKILDFFRPVISVLRKKDHQARGSHLLYLTCSAFLVHFGIYFYPGGIFTMLPLTDTFMHSVLYIYYILAAAGSELKDSLWWKKYLLVYQLMHFLWLCIHGAWFFFTPNCAGPVFVKGFQACYAGMSFLLFTYYYAHLLLPNKVRQDKLKSKVK